MEIGSTAGSETHFLRVITTVYSWVGEKVEDDRFPVLRNHNAFQLIVTRVGILPPVESNICTFLLWVCIGGFKREEWFSVVFCHFMRDELDKGIIWAGQQMSYKWLTSHVGFLLFQIEGIFFPRAETLDFLDSVCKSKGKSNDRLVHSKCICLRTPWYQRQWHTLDLFRINY